MRHPTSRTITYPQTLAFNALCSIIPKSFHTIPVVLTFMHHFSFCLVRSDLLRWSGSLYSFYYLCSVQVVTSTFGIVWHSRIPRPIRAGYEAKSGKRQTEREVRSQLASFPRSLHRKGEESLVTGGGGGGGGDKLWTSSARILAEPIRLQNNHVTIL